MAKTVSSIESGNKNHHIRARSLMEREFRFKIIRSAKQECYIHAHTWTHEISKVARTAHAQNNRKWRTDTVDRTLEKSNVGMTKTTKTNRILLSKCRAETPPARTMAARERTKHRLEVCLSPYVKWCCCGVRFFAVVVVVAAVVFFFPCFCTF